MALPSYAAAVNKQPVVLSSTDGHWSVSDETCCNLELLAFFELFQTIIYLFVRRYKTY